ncbi:MAG: VOC family protein [Alphaproteobacteria bacterium]
MYKPTGYTDISPYLIVDDAQATLNFIRDAFSGEQLRVHLRDNGEIMHAEARIGDSVVMIGQMAGGADAHIHLYVSDVEAVFDRAISAGGELVQRLEVKDDGDRRGAVRDTNGTTWWVSRQES